MIADKVRMEPYVAALRRYVTPDSVVLDIGAGTGIFALLAAQFGARKVYAIEPNEAIQVARQLAADNGLADRIEFIEELSTRISLPEKADVIISDMRGTLPLFEQHLVSIKDARARLLAPNGVLIPQRDTLWATLVSAPELYDSYVAPWQQHNHGFNTQAALRVVLNTWGAGRVKPEQVLAPPQFWTEIDYRQVSTLNARGEMNWTLEHGATAHGMLVWFDTVLADEIGFSNAPGGGADVYGSAFFPFQTPLELSPADRVTVQLRADLVGEDYTWSWQTAAQEATGAAKAQFKQSSFYGVPFSPKQLRKRAEQYLPRLNETGKLDFYVLGLMSEEFAQGEIAQQLVERYPQRFADWKVALTYVALLSEKYSE